MRPAAKSSAEKSPAPKRRVRASRMAVPKPYHHGDLRRVLVDAALQLVGEGGAAAVSVREAARRAGVSAGAPANDPLARFRCLGLAYLRWAIRNPTHFEVISSRRLFDHDNSAGVSRNNAELIELTERTLAEAFAAGQLRSDNLKAVQLAGRALVYGFARMNIDGHFPRWGVDGADVERTAESILDFFIEGIASRI
jgi:hypothetical protein